MLDDRRVFDVRDGRPAVAVGVTSRRTVMAGLAALPLSGCAVWTMGPSPLATTVGGVEMLDPQLATIIAPDARAQVLATGYGWAEGPVWVPAGGYLLFNDPGNNVMYRYRPGGTAEEFLRPSGLQTPVPPEIREAGANGMAMDPAGRLVITDSGTRAIVAIDLATMRRTVLVDRFEGKRFNSPNDLAIARNGAIYFTDPPYGFTAAEESPLREVQHNGLYLRDPDGTLHLLDRHHRPNGVGLSPDERTLYLSLSDEQRPQVLAYTLDAGGRPVGPPRLFHDMARYHAAGRPGLPDGMDVAADGIVFATGPGGVHVLAPDGRLLGIIGTGTAVANCAVGQMENGRPCLYLTAHTTLARVPLRG